MESGARYAPQWNGIGGKQESSALSWDAQKAEEYDTLEVHLDQGTQASLGQAAAGSG